MHRISEVTIHNYRSCQSVGLPLADYTPLVGYNNAGKSNMLRAIEWLIAPKSLPISDFFDPEQPIIVEAVIAGIDDGVLEGLGRHRPRFEPHVSEEGTITVRTIQPSPSCPARAIQKEAWINQEDGDGWHNPGGIKEALSALFPDVIVVPAMEDASADLSKNQKNTTIGKLIAAIMAPLQEAHGEAIQSALDEVRALLADDGESRAEALRQFDDDATQAVQNFFPGIRVKVEVPPPDIDAVFKSGRVRMADDRNGDAPDWRDVSSHGHGAQRAAHMALIKMLADRGGANVAGRKLLLIDEPELYMHPQMIEQVRFALKSLSSAGFQVAFSTHSPLFVGRDDIAQAIMVRKDGGHTITRNTMQNCCSVLENRQTQADTLLDLSNSSQLLFCDRAVLAEGKTERVLLPVLIEEVLGTSLLAESAAMVVMSGSDGFPGACAVLTALGFNQKVIADLDFAFRSGVLMGIWSREDQLYQDCLTVIAELAPEVGFGVDESGLPTKRGEVTSEVAFNALATSDNGRGLVEQVHDLFLGQRIWVWDQGSIEYHLGMLGKGSWAIRQFRNELLRSDSQLEDVVADLDGVRAALQWALQD